MSAIDAATVRALLIALAARRPLSASDRASARELAEPALREALLVAADALRVRGLILARLTRDVSADLPTAARVAFDRAMHDARRRTAVQDMERERVLARLRRAAVEPVLLKGAALRIAYYGDPAERYAGDIDILVAPTAVTAARSALREAGYADVTASQAAAYERFHFHYALRHPSGQMVELHWALTEPDALVRLDASAFLKHARTHQRQRAPAVKLPRAEDMLLHLAAQSADEPGRLFARAVDVDRVVAREPAVRWDGVVAAAQQAQITTALWVQLRIARDLLDTPIPGIVLSRLRPGPMARSHLDLLRLTDRATCATRVRDGEHRLSQLWMLAGDHGVRASLQWLATQGFLGPTDRATTEAGSRVARWRRNLRDVVSLAGVQASLYGRRPVRTG